MRIDYNDFTIDKYTEILRYVASHYHCVNFTNYTESEKGIIWRHDIDFSVHKAHIFAKMEQELGIKSVYYFLLRIEHYNIFEKGICQLIREIKDMGHDVGLHFNHSHYGSIDSEKELEKHLQYEKDIFQQETGLEVNSFAYHDTNPQILKFNKAYYSGMLNVYSEKIRTEIPYCSDSFGIWRFNPLMEELEKNRTLQVLTHPILWTEEALPPRDRLFSVFSDAKERFIVKYNDFIGNNIPELLNQ